MSDIFVVDPIAYIGGKDSAQVYVYDYSNPAAPIELIDCRLSLPDEVNDVAVEGSSLYVPLQRDSDTEPGLYVYELVDPTSPTCPLPAPTVVAEVPSAHNVHFATIFGTRYAFFAGDDPRAAHGVYIFDVTDPANPVKLGPAGNEPTWDFPSTCGDCKPHDTFTAEIGGVPYLFVASLADGIYIVDITSPAAPVTRSHYTYTWNAPDSDGDTVPDVPCRVSPELFFPTLGNRTHDLQVTDDGQFLLTGDETRCGGHVFAWDIQEILTSCDPDCPTDSVSPVAEFRANDVLPNTVHKIRLDGDFAYVTWYEEGLQILDISNLDGQSPSQPRVNRIGSFDTLVPNNPDTMSNAGVFSSWGVAFDQCYLHVSDWGSPSDGGNPQPARYRVHRYTGGPLPNRPLRISKDNILEGALIASWGDVPFSRCFNLYRGTLPTVPGGWSTRVPIYDHDMVLDPAQPELCGIPLTLAQLLDEIGAQPSYYYLVTSRNGCDGIEGNYGHASDGTLRPAATNPCLPSLCP